LQKELKVPVGFLTVAYGASTAESWIRRETMAADPLLKPMLDEFDALENYYRDHPGALASAAPKPRRPSTRGRATRQRRCAIRCRINTSRQSFLTA